MPLGLITESGRILTARLLMGEPLDGITHCALGDGDASFSDPRHPPAPNIQQTALHHELARKPFYKRSYLAEDAEGALRINGVRYRETGAATRSIGFFFAFEEHEANHFTLKEYGFFGGNVAYVDGHSDEYAANGVYHPDTNPQGQVRSSGFLYEIKNVPDFNKTADTRLELVGVVKL